MYLVYTFCNLFAPSLLHLLGPKWTVFFGKRAILPSKIEISRFFYVDPLLRRIFPFEPDLLLPGFRTDGPWLCQ